MAGFLIYALVDPRDGAWRYIGKSERGLKRPADHLRPSYLKAKTRKNAWLKSLLAMRLRPRVEVLENLSSCVGLSDAECDWIAEARRVGVNLTNGTDGGDGASGGSWKWSDESKTRWSEANQGRVSSFNGRRHSAHTRGKISKSRGGTSFVDDLGNRYDTLSDAADATGANLYNISAVLHGRRTRAGGRVFTYLEA
jgi:hypothetical protein